MRNLKKPRNLKLTKDNIAVGDYNVQSSSIDRLSDDVFTIIFELCANETQGPAHDANWSGGRYSSPQDEPFQLVCAHVCRRWRDIIFRTSTVWSKIRIEDRRSLQFAKHVIPLISCRFGLLVCFGCSPTRTIGAFFKQLSLYLDRHGERLSSLRLNMCPHGIVNFFASLKRPLQRTLILECTTPACNWRGGVLLGESATDFALRGFDELRHLTLRSCPLPSTSVTNPWLLSLRLSNAILGNPHHLSWYLSMTPNIRELDIYWQIPDPRRSLPPSTISPVSMPLPLNLDRLERLKLAAFAFFPLPSSFFNAVFPTLYDLCLNVEGIPEDRISEVVEFTLQQPSIAMLTINGDNCCRKMPSTVCCRILERLSKTIQSDSAKLLPNLTTLAISATAHSETGERRKMFAPTCAELLCLLVEKRIDVGYPLRQLVVTPPAQSAFAAVQNKLHLIGRASLEDF